VRLTALGCKRLIVVAIVFLPLLVSPFTFPLQQKSRSSQLYSSTSPSKGSQSERLSKAKAMLEELLIDTPELMEKAASTDPTVVPETYWSNGHLQPQADFVTRWAKGVKVAEPLVKYDPIAAEKLLFRQPTKWMIRNVQIALPIGWWAVGVVGDYFLNRSKKNRRVRARQLNRAISGLGPAIIKGGQALASRSDLLPSEYLEELQKLQDDVPRFSNQLALNTVEQELGCSFDDVFELVEEEPIAAASIGQVYKARLRANGDTVALKIMRPQCEEIIALDLYVLRWWSGVYNKIFDALGRDINVQSIIDDFGELIYREIDYVAEAANAQRFNELYAGMATDVFVPKVYSELTTSKVLTMEWVDGFRLTDSENLAAFELDPKFLVNTLTQCSLRQILENGFFHADPHAGNLLACRDGRLCYLDFGMMSYADRAQRNGFLLLTVHIVNRDWESLTALFQKLGFIPEGTDLKPIAVALEDALPDVLNSQVSEVNFSKVVSKLGDIMYTYPFSLPPFYIAIIRCLGVLEGLAIQVDPQARIVSEAYPYVASRVLTDSQTDLQEALKRLALDPNDGSIRWDRLEGLLDEAQDSKGYDVTAAVDLLSDYLLSSSDLLPQLTTQIVAAADSLGTESLEYIVKAARAIASQDEEGAFSALQSIIGQLDDEDTNIEDDVVAKLEEVLPDPSPSMKRMGRILQLLFSSTTNGGSSTEELMRWVPIFRKLANSPQIQQMSSEILAQLGERALSRTLRAAFGLPPTPLPYSEQSTVTEDTTAPLK